VARSLLRRLLMAPSLILLAILILLLPAAMLWARGWLLSKTGGWTGLHDFISSVHEAVLAATGVLASAAAVVSIAGRKVRNAVDKLVGFHDQLEKAVAD
jgi:hypothetical protein